MNLGRALGSASHKLLRYSIWAVVQPSTMGLSLFKICLLNLAMLFTSLRGKLNSGLSFSRKIFDRITAYAYTSSGKLYSLDFKPSGARYIGVPHFIECIESSLYLARPRSAIIGI